jgi:hypothetical protein
MIHNQKLVKRWFEKKDSSIFGTWYRETVLYKGGLAQKLSLNSRLAMDMGEILFSTRKEWIHDFEAVFEELDFSLGFRQLFKKSGRSNIPRLLDALWLELGELKNYKKLREIYLKRQQASGVTAGFSLSHNSFLMYEPEIESAPIAYLITKSAEYIIKELHAYDECVLVMDLVNQVLSEKLSTHSDHFVKRLVILNQKILALARRTSLISAAGKAFLLGMLIGSIPFTSDGEFGTERIREIECLANTLHLQGNAKKLLKSTLSAIFYDGADKIDLNKMIITISESFRSGESGVRLEMRDDTN